jgi:flagellar hook-basal body complex protein FliE
MDSLAAIRQLFSPQLRAAVSPKLEEMSGAKAVIPAAELGRLGVPAAPTVTAPTEGSFGNLLGRMVQDVNAKQLAAGQSVQGLMSGQAVSLHQTVIAMEEASVSFQLMVEVRNKLLESYQELMRMQI